MEKTTVEAKLKECLAWFDSNEETHGSQRNDFLMDVIPIYMKYQESLSLRPSNPSVNRSLTKTSAGEVVQVEFLDDGWVMVKSKNKEKAMPVEEARDAGLVPSRFKYRKPVPSDAKNSRGHVYNEFMLALAKYSYLPEKITRTDLGDLLTTDYGFCSKCNVNFVEDVARGDMICSKCGETTRASHNGVEAFPYGTPVDTGDYCYKRINHFNECISQFHAREKSTIPYEIIDAVRQDFRKSRIDAKKDITASKVRKVLRKLKMSKYFEHCVQITHILHGSPPPKMTIQQEEKLRNMFRMIQKPFEETCPKNRKNFLNYSYTIHKMCQLLGYDEFMEYFPLLKSREKLWGQDMMWKKICSKLNWQFIPSTFIPISSLP